jgi:hypothetical protein
MDNATMDELRALVSILSTNPVNSMTAENQQRCMCVLSIANQTRRLGREPIVTEFIQLASMHQPKNRPQSENAMNPLWWESRLESQTVLEEEEVQDLKESEAPLPSVMLSEYSDPLAASIWKCLQPSKYRFDSVTVPVHADSVSRIRKTWWSVF